ncbi:metal ABC transporter permease [Rickettsia montanensis]|uniref:High-affinity zinc uptake system membrane protein ZnuB n=1 Tax=Rickettsia montanensis (strain OSU 85-930) TaxID=1105114 RepID=H8KBZ5_RICMS|nr:metal ABC transporter permease [Rickettsia montanensis]AFC73330.1 Zinc/manganese ABC transporter permease protein [Rickettsia montanensis str. OSU 85-930]
MTLIILALILISCIFAPLGCIALWKRYIYFGDGFAHSSFLVASISIIAHVPLIYSGIIVAILFSFFVFIFKNNSEKNAVINLISSFMLAVALVINYFTSLQNNIVNLLFGDILSVSFNDLMILAIVLITIIGFIVYFYNQILLIIINRDIAVIKGLKVNTIELIFLLLLSLSVFSAIKIVGVLMVTAILLIPAMIARFVAYSPSQMIIISILISLFINFCAAFSSLYFDLPLTPLFIILGTFLYGLLYLKRLL